MQRIPEDHKKNDRGKSFPNDEVNGLLKSIGANEYVTEKQRLGELRNDRKKATRGISILGKRT